MKDMFSNMENYTSIMTLNPEVYGFVNITALVGKNGSKRSYRLKRTMEYKATYSPLRDRMFAALTAAYDKIFELLADKKMNDGNLKNYYLISIESANDIPRRILSFDMYMLQADSFKDLVNKPEFRNLPGIDDRDKHVAIFAFGYQYEKDMNVIDITNKVFRCKAFKQTSNAIKVYNFEEDSDMVFDIDDDKCKQFIHNCFEGCDRYIYNIGLELEDYTHDHEFHNIDKEESTEEENSSTIPEEKEEDKSEPEIETVENDTIEVIDSENNTDDEDELLENINEDIDPDDIEPGTGFKL